MAVLNDTLDTFNSGFFTLMESGGRPSQQWQENTTRSAGLNWTNEGIEGLCNFSSAALQCIVPNATTTTPSAPHSDRNLGFLKYIILMAFLSTCTFGAIGNTLTIIVILRNPKMKTVVSCFILNLAIADDLFIFSIPFILSATFQQSWIFGDGLCKIITYLYSVNMYCSIYTMIAMALDRYLAIAKTPGLMHYRTIRNAIKLCVVIWLICFLLMMPVWLFARTRTIRGTKNNVCRLFWPEASVLKHAIFWTYFELIVGFVIPVLVIFMCYILLLRSLRRQGPREDVAQRPAKKLTLITCIATVVFVICWTPYHISSYIMLNKRLEIHRLMERKMSFQPDPDEVANFIIFNTVARILAFISSCSNPIIYAISSGNFRK